MELYSPRKKSPYQKADVYVNNQKLTTWEWKEGVNPETILQVPKKLNTNNTLEIKFEIDNPQSPKELGLGEDIRTIALGFIDLLIKAR